MIEAPQIEGVLKADGSVQLTGTWNAGSANIQTSHSATGANDVVNRSTMDDAIANATGMYLEPGNQHMVCLATTADGQKATNTTLAGESANGGMIFGILNGVMVHVGNGVKTSELYLSGDGGTTARTYAAAATGDTIHWVGSVAGYQLTTSYRLTLVYASYVPSP